MNKRVDANMIKLIGHWKSDAIPLPPYPNSPSLVWLLKPYASRQELLLHPGGHPPRDSLSDHVIVHNVLRNLIIQDCPQSIFSSLKHPSEGLTNFNT
jgi:hypothetical protein